MPTTSEITNFDSIIFDTARKGTAVNPNGLPPALSFLVVAQAKHETGNYTSNAFRSGNNAFGYSYVPGAKYQLPAPGAIADNGQPLARYDSLANSTKEIVDWIYRRKNEGSFPSNLATITDPAQYANLLKSAGYYGDTVLNYTNGLLRYLKQLPASVKFGFGSFVLLVTVLYLFQKGFFKTTN